MEDLQAAVRAFHRAFGVVRPVEVYVLDLVSEVGELAKAYLKTTRYGEAEPDPGLLEALSEEAGDALYLLLSLIEAAGLDARELLEATLAKYRARLGARGSMGSAPED